MSYSFFPVCRVRIGDTIALPPNQRMRPATLRTWAKVVDIDLGGKGSYGLHTRTLEREPRRRIERFDDPMALVEVRTDDPVPRIAFAGASGTGKTTLAKAVQKALGIPLCPVGSRSVAEAMGFASPYDVDRAGQRAAFQRRLLEEKAAWEAHHRATGFVTDRTHYDNLAYTAMHASGELTDKLVARAKAASDLYTTVVFCPMVRFWNTGDDAARVTSRAYHETYEVLVLGMLQRHLGDHFDHATGDTETVLLRMGWTGGTSS